MHAIDVISRGNNQKVGKKRLVYQQVSITGCTLIKNTEMVQASFFYFVGGLVLLVLVFALYIFPYVICPAIPEDPQVDLKDPIRGFCSVFR